MHVYTFFLFFFYGSPSGGSLYLATPLGEVTKFDVAQVSNWSKVPCSREHVLLYNECSYVVDM